MVEIQAAIWSEQAQKVVDHIECLSFNEPTKEFIPYFDITKPLFLL
jgi:hypothetical protein